MESNKKRKNLTESDFVSMSDRELTRYFLANPDDKRAVNAINDRPNTQMFSFMPDPNPPQSLYAEDIEQPDPPLTH